jgi:hypothetical protein
MRRSLRNSRVAALLAAMCALAAAACGDVTEDNIVAPDGAEIEFNPSSVTWTAPAGIDVIETFTVTVRNADGIPLDEIPVTFTAAIAPGAFQFVNPDGTDSGLPRVTRTTDENGVIILQVHVTCACTDFADDIEARSGTAFASANIRVDP